MTNLAGQGQETLRIIEQGWYTAPSGRRIEIAGSLKAAVDGATLYRPDDFPVSRRYRTEIDYRRRSM